MILTGNSLSAQTANDVTGKYSLKNPQGDALNFVDLFLTPDHTFSVCYFGGAKFGTWKIVDDEFLILKSDANAKDHFILMGRYNPNLSADSVFFEFHRFDRNRAFYSFDNQSYENTMHPLFKEYPTCVADLKKLSLPKDLHKSVQFAALIDETGYYNIDFSTPNIEVEVVEYSFDLPKSFNEFRVILNKEKFDYREALLIKLSSKNNDIIIENQTFIKRDNWEDVVTEDKNLLTELSYKREQIFDEYKSTFTDNCCETDFEYIISLKAEENIKIDNEGLFNVICE